MIFKNMILYEDRDVIVCHKPAGIAVQSARLGQKDMVSILNNYLAEKGEQDLVHVVHRLDQPVEGVVVFARTKKAAAELGKQIQQDRMKKVYHALCCREAFVPEVFDTKAFDPEAFDPKAGDTDRVYSLTDYLIKDGKTNTSSVGRQGQKDAKKAELSFRILASSERLLLAEIDLKTGRHHQIRVQMSHAGLPLYGDQKYNPRWEEWSAGEQKAGLALCAVSLTFRHPSSGKKMTFKVQPENAAFHLLEAQDKAAQR